MARARTEVPERPGLSHAAEGMRLKEACKINQSLTFLGRFINFLSEAQSKSKRHIAYINYRESKLTHLLSDSLGIYFFFTRAE